MSTQHTSALGALTFAVVLVLVLFGPGLLVGLLLRLRGLALVALAPGISVGVVTVGGVAAGWLHLAWRPATFLASCLIAVVGAALAGRVTMRWKRRRTDSLRVYLGALAGGAIAVVTVVVSFRRAMGSLRAVPAQPDTAYHLNVIRMMLDSHHISSLTASGLVSAGPPGFYPAGWHGVATTVLQIAPIEIVVASNIFAVVTAALVWTAGCLMLARQAFGAHGATLFVAGVMSASFTAMPYLLGGYGTLWPYLLGMALVPAGLGCVLSVCALARDDRLGRPMAVIGLVVTLPGILLSHPDAVASLALIVLAVLCLEAPLWSWRHRHRRPVLAVAILVVFVSLPFLWWGVVKLPQVHHLTVFSSGPPQETIFRASGEALLNDPRFGAPLWILGAIVVVGLIRALLERSAQWQPVVWAAAWLAFIGVAAVQDHLTRAVTGVWYNNSPRLAAITPIGGMLLATTGLVWLSHRLHRALAARRAGRSSPASQRALALTVTGTLVLAFLVGSRGNYVPEHVARLGRYFHPLDSRNALLSAKEYKALQAIARHVPPQARVADDPWRGTNLLYAIGDRAVMFPAVSADNSPDRLLVGGHLYQAASPAHRDVCAALRRAGVDYVITGGTTLLMGHETDNPFDGVDAAAGRPGFQQVATVDPYTLWRITACGGS